MKEENNEARFPALLLTQRNARLYIHLAQYTPYLSPTPGKYNMASIWSGLSWQTKSSM